MKKETLKKTANKPKKKVAAKAGLSSKPVLRKEFASDGGKTTAKTAKKRTIRKNSLPLKMSIKPTPSVRGSKKDIAKSAEAVAAKTVKKRKAAVTKKTENSVKSKTARKPRTKKATVAKPEDNLEALKITINNPDTEIPVEQADKEETEKESRGTPRKNVLLKNTLRLIGATKTRFISLLLITFIGASFLMGLSSVSVVMEHTVDTFDDTNNLQDIQIYSNYGFSEENFEAIRAIDGISDVYGSKWFDCYGIFDDGSKQVLRVQELNSDIASINLKSGRMPENEYECLALYSKYEEKNIALGSSLYLIKDTDEELDEVISNRIFTVVGLCETPEYLTFTSETSTFHNLNLDDVIFVDNGLFLSEYYTCAYVTVEGADGYNSFSDEYHDFISDYVSRLNVLAETEKDYNRDAIIEKAQAQLDETQAELDAQKKSGQAQLDAAKSQLDAAYVKIISGSAAIDATQNVIDALNDQYDEQKENVDSQSAYVNSTISGIESAYGKSFEEVLTNMSALYAVYNGLDYSKLDPYVIAYRDGTQKDLDTYNVQLAENQAKQEEIEKELEGIADEITIVTKASLEYDYSQSGTQPEPDTGFDIQIEGLNEEKEELIDELTELKKDELLLDIKAELAQTEIDIIDNRDEAAIRSLIDTMKTEITDLAGVGSIPDTYNNLIKLKTAQIQLDTSRLFLNETKKQIEEGEDSIVEGQTEVESGTAQYKSALARYNASQATFASTVSEAQAKLDKAAQDLEDLSEGQWTILDRNSHVSSVVYKNSSDQMKTIGTAIPIMFFLVAILVCMTTMTRLIDEQRGQIGCLLALGFTKNGIALQYVLYALIASLTGSVIGVFAGVMTLPKIIYSIWAMSYRLPEMVFCFPVQNALISILSFVVLMCLVTYIVLKKNLMDCPATLLRPKAPKTARKTLIERVGFIWSHLSFTSRITVRNIFRYKQRFFMTIIGIAGCVALLILGFGIQDSITVIPTHFGSIFHYTHVLEISDKEYKDSLSKYLQAGYADSDPIAALSYSSKVYLNDEENIFYTYVVDSEDAGSFVNLKDYQTKEPIVLGNDGIVISYKFANRNGLKVGDVLTMESVNGVRREATIAGIFECYIYDNIVMSSEYYESIYGLAPDYNKIYFTFSGDVNELNDQLSLMSGYVSLDDNTKMASAFSDLVQSLNLVVMIVVVFAGMLAFVVLINLTEVNISERKRELATLKVLGFNRREIRSYIFKELIILTIIGSLVGIPLGYAAHAYIIGIIDYNLIFIPNVVESSTVIISIIITYVFLIFILLIEARPIGRIKMVESLKSIE